jgi:serine/threonine protein kinase
MVRSTPNPIYRLLDKDYAESFAAYKPRTSDLYDVVDSLLPRSWSIRRHDMWFYCSPCAHQVPPQGWKIHISATGENCREILEKASRVLFTHSDVSFKFVVDCALLRLFNSKTWPRGASGKFITIYPADSRRFLDLIEEIDERTVGLQGPYILSDQRYKNSRVLFYRYGGMRTQTALNVKGEKIPVLQDPGGNVIPDLRLAYPVIPPWEAPIVPVSGVEEVRTDKVSLSHGRYLIEKAIAFSSAGGVYCARDNLTGRKVVVKEARPCINATNKYDAVGLLKKEHRLLDVLAVTDVAPQPVDLFQEWEHWFLVEEFIEGAVMGRHSAANNILLRTRATAREREEWRTMFAGLCVDLIRILNVLHNRDIVFADLSPNNLIVTANGKGLRVIDFEGAHQIGVDPPANLYTPGFVSQSRAPGRAATREDDYYSAGAVLLAYLLPINGLLHLNPQARREFIAFIQSETHLSDKIVDLINRLMDHPEQGVSAPGSGVVEMLDSARPGAASADAQEPAKNYQSVVDSIVTHLNGVAEYGRCDRLYPADPKVFSTNPLSLGYGAAGVAYALHKLTGKIPTAAIDWILQHKITSADYPPGLYVGMSGIAWSLLEIGMTEAAEEIFRATLRSPLLHDSADLFHGLSGWGMTALRLFQATEKEIYLERAREAGRRLLVGAKVSEHGLYWTSASASTSVKERPLGIAHGSSGVGLFLLYLYLATGDENHLDTARRALDFDLAAGVRTKDGGLSWSESVESSSPLYPYWRFGSAGIGMVTARFQRLMGSPRYQSILEQIFIDTDRKFAVFPGRCTGLAGLGEFLLDMHDLVGARRFLESANRVAEGIMHFRVERNGTAFPGQLLSRLSCDYGTGSAGIALFFNRLLGKQGSDFMLDDLFRNCRHERSVKEDVGFPALAR